MILWPIEHVCVWAIMTQQVYQHPAQETETIEELSTRVENALKNFNVKTLKKLIHEIPFRIKKAIIQNEGKKN